MGIFIFIMETEIWKPVKDYPNYYISNLGNVKSLKYNRERILKPANNGNNYLNVRLSKKGKCKTKSIHQLVAIAFLNHTPCTHKLVVNHINFNRADNRIVNLEIVTARENLNRKHLKSTSKYTGVNWYKTTNKWVATISENRKKKHIGYFKNEIDASNAYENYKKQLLL